MRAKHFFFVYQQLNLGRRIDSSGSNAIDLLFIVAPAVCGDSLFGPCFVIQCLCHSSFAIILMGKRELVALLYLSSLCLVTVGVIRLFLASAVCDCGTPMHLDIVPPLVPQSVNQEQGLILSLVSTFGVQQTVRHRGQLTHLDHIVRASVAGINAFNP